MQALGSSSTRQQHSVVCRASGQLNRPTHIPTPPGRPQLPKHQQQQQALQQQHAQDQLLLHPSPSSSSRLQQGPSRPGQLLSPPSRTGLSAQQQLAAARRFDDGDTRMAAYDSMVLQITNSEELRSQVLSSDPPSFNRGPCRVRQFMATAMKGAHLQRPTPLQGALMAAVASGRDVLCCAPPGTGSSTAALLGVITQLLSIPRSVPRGKAWPLALVLCPTRELALQLSGQASQLVAGSQLKVACVTGGAPLAQQALDLRKGCDLLIATPGRLIDLMGSSVNLMRLKYMVIEEVEELMGPALHPVIKQLLHHPTMPSHSQRQTLALGSSALPLKQQLAAAADAVRPNAVLVRATWPSQRRQQPPQQPQPSQEGDGDEQQQEQQRPHKRGRRRLRRLEVAAAPYAALLANPAAAAAAAGAAAADAIAPSLRQQFLGVAPQLKQRTLLRLLAAGVAGVGPSLQTSATAAGSVGAEVGLGAPTRGLGTGQQGPTVVFTNTAAAADEVVAQLEAAGVAAGALHHGRSQGQREEALQCFRFGVTQVLVACGAAYRGLDLPDVSLIVNHELPLSLAEYARRAGVAGRQGRQGGVVTLVVPGDGALAGPFAALLAAGGQQVPDWLAAMVAGSSGSSDAGSSGDSGSSEAAAAAGSGAAAGSQQQQQKQSTRRQEQQGSALFSVVGKGLQFGGYSSGRSCSSSSSSSSSGTGDGTGSSGTDAAEHPGGQRESAG